jgi:hypothetical protein
MTLEQFDNLVIGQKLELIRPCFFRVFNNAHLEKRVYQPLSNPQSRRPGWQDITLPKGTQFYLIERDEEWNSWIVAYDTRPAREQPIYYSVDDYTHLVYTELTRADRMHIELIPM